MLIEALTYQTSSKEASTQLYGYQRRSHYLSDNEERHELFIQLITCSCFYYFFSEGFNRQLKIANQNI